MSTQDTNRILQQKYPHHVQSQITPDNSNQTTQTQPGPQIFTHNFRKYYILFIHILQINNTQIILDFFYKKIESI